MSIDFPLHFKSGFWLSLLAQIRGTDLFVYKKESKYLVSFLLLGLSLI